MQTKSDFIRANPKLTASEVVRRASAVGMELSVEHVYAVRSHDRKRAKRPPRAPRINKAAFVRFHAGKTPAEVMELAGAAGIDLGLRYLYALRHEAKIGPPGVAVAADEEGAPASALVRLIIELGTRRARQLIADVEERLADW